MFAAIAAAERGSRVVLLEQNEKLGKKIYITGKGRCNLTNAGDMEELFANVMTNRKFLYSAFYACDNQRVIDFFERSGCRTKVERGSRVFPVSDHASDVIRALSRKLEQLGVEVMLRTRAAKIVAEPCGQAGIAADSSVREGDAAQPSVQTGEEADSSVREGDAAHPSVQTGVSEGVPEQSGSYVRGVELADHTFLRADAVIVATGGFSYQTTGATGDGYRFARELGHTVIEPAPSLVPFLAKEPYVADMQGLALKNIAIRILHGKKLLYEEFGELLFTHFGVSGPVILSASAAIKPATAAQELSLLIDLKPALTQEQLDKRILRDFEGIKNKQFKNALEGLLPSKMIPVVTRLCGILPEKKVNEITKEERRGLLALIKAFPVTLCGVRGFNEAIITKGGVKVNEVNPKTMESKRIKNLYFCGEVLDVDAMTGGFNLQIAWSTGYLAGISAGVAHENSKKKIRLDEKINCTEERHGKNYLT